eukprot:3171760-Heterocapsa_arctica.AAC.1
MKTIAKILVAKGAVAPSRPPRRLLARGQPWRIIRYYPGERRCRRLRLEARVRQGLRNWQER